MGNRDGMEKWEIRYSEDNQRGKTEMTAIGQLFKVRKKKEAIQKRKEKDSEI